MKGKNIKTGTTRLTATAPAPTGNVGTGDPSPSLARSRWLTIAGGVLLAAAALVVADEAARAWAATGGIEEVKSFASKLTNYVTAVAASVAVLFMAISGVRWTMSSGNPAKQADAKSALVSAAAGLAIALSANVIVSLVVAALQ